MSQTLRALSSKLKIQLSELYLNVQSIELKLADLENQYHESLQNISSASVIPEHLQPEQEMARLHFILCEQQNLDNLNATKTTLLTELNLLKEKHLRLNTELKRIEKYQENQRIIKKQHNELDQQKDRDEWGRTYL